MDVLARLDEPLGPSDHLPVAAHDFSELDRRQRDLVAGRHRVDHFEGGSLDPQFHARRQGHSRHGHVVGGMEMNSGVFRRGEFSDFKEHV